MRVQKKITALIPLPLYYNPDPSEKRRPVEDEKFVRTAEEIAAMFGGGTLYRFEQESPRGFWWNAGIVSDNVLALLEVDFPDTAANRAKLISYARDVLKERFEQDAIYVKFVGPIESLVVEDEEI
ncbi:MAG: hypothetical protein A3H28_01900 [Acidobacteria bacterium RIFCSPLOWO2_02_FULL_61_28]|nr:MAG: hypothetical protein A3H28_01900 [Acidobacteria bacterium RIFCSPLOWO2_02_FULL_61_28]